MVGPTVVRFGQLSKPLWKEFKTHYSCALSRTNVPGVELVPGVVEVAGLGSPRK
jgi:hypothetical protein